MTLPAATKPNLTGNRAHAALCVAETHDVDEQAALLKGWNQTYAQISSGSFTGTIQEVHLSGVHIFFEETSNALFQTGALPPSVHAVGVPLKCHGQATFCGTPCRGDGLHLFSGNDGFEFHSPNGLIMAGVVVASELLASGLAETDRHALSKTLRSPHLRRAAQDKVEGLRQMLTGVIDVLRGAPHLAENQALVGGLRRSLTAMLTDALLDDDPRQDPLIVPGRRWQVVAEARALIVANPDLPYTVAELCRALGVSRRTLQYCFEDVLDINPAAFLRIIRLNGARRAIKTSGTVTEAATMWGFWHLSRFSHDYKCMFGELPSDTYRRCHTGARPD